MKVAPDTSMAFFIGKEIETGEKCKPSLCFNTKQANETDEMKVGHHSHRWGLGKWDKRKMTGTKETTSDLMSLKTKNPLWNSLLIYSKDHLAMAATSHY